MEKECCEKCNGRIEDENGFGRHYGCLLEQCNCHTGKKGLLETVAELVADRIERMMNEDKAEKKTLVSLQDYLLYAFEEVVENDYVVIDINSVHWFIETLEVGTELRDIDDGQLRYVLHAQNDGSDIQITGYDDFCVCESWYSPQDIFDRFEKTGGKVDIKKLPLDKGIIVDCLCPQEPDDFSGASEGDR